MTLDITKPNRSQTYGDAVDATRENIVAVSTSISAVDSLLQASDIPGLASGKVDYEAHKLNLDAHGLIQVKSRINANEMLLNTARGSATELGERLNVGLTSSGALKLSSLANKWIAPGDVPTYISATSFSVPGDKRGIYIAGAHLRVTQSADYVYVPIVSSSFSLGFTTVVIDPAYPLLTSGMSAVELALIAFDNTIANSVANLQSSITLQQSAIDLLEREEIAGFKNGIYTTSEVLIRRVVVRNFSLPINFVGSQFRSTANATAQRIFNIQKNAVNIGTATFAASQSVATFVAASSTSFVTGDVVTIVAPATVDATLANLSFNFLGTLT